MGSRHSHKTIIKSKRQKQNKKEVIKEKKLQQQNNIKWIKQEMNKTGRRIIQVSQ